VTAILQTRVRIPYTQAGLSAFPQATGRVVGSQIFRIEAEGYVAGEPRARLTAIVERGGAQGGNPLGQVLSGSAPRQALSGTAPRQPLSATAPRQPLTVLSWRSGEER
jgi:hypothetical protein